MIKKHFPNSQFIIVSLKDGMFNNANVLFKTKFERGTSGVDRFVEGCVHNDAKFVSKEAERDMKEYMAMIERQRAEAASAGQNKLFGGAGGGNGKMK